MNAIHKWEINGLGKAPFKCVGVAEIPSPSLVEHNPTAYNNALRMLPKGYGCGTCAVCGMPLKYNYLIKAADGSTFSVGSECVLKRGNHASMLITEVKAQRNKMLREKRAEKRQAEYAARQAKKEAEKKAREDAERKENNGLTLAELEQQKKDALANARKELLTPLAERLADGRQGFCDNVANDMKRGEVPRGRGIDLVCDILAKQAGRRNSAAYNAEYDEVENILTAASAIE